MSTEIENGQGPDKAEEVRVEGQKNLQELMEAIKPLMLEPWSDISRKSTDKEIEAGLLKRKINWYEIFNKYYSEHKPEDISVKSLTQWLMKNYNVPHTIV